MARKEVVDNILALMPEIDQIRNISVIAHVDHGKSTLTDSLCARAGFISEGHAGNTRYLDTRPDEKFRTITIKSASVAMVFDIPVEKKSPHYNPNWPNPPPEKAPEEAKEKSNAPETKQYLVNLIDSPGHVDFSSEVTAALRVTDGAVVVVDCVEGVCVQTETVLRQALAERIKPVLFINKLDRFFLEMQMDSEDAYQSLRRACESVNVVIATHKDDLLGDVTVYPQAGTVAFGSGLHGWGFTLDQIASIYHDKFDISKKKMMKKLWGDHFYNKATKKWQTTPEGPNGKRLPRGFCMLVLEPLRQLFHAVINDHKAVYEEMLAARRIKLPAELKGKALLKKIMQSWMPAADALLQLIVKHLPSPKTAQKYRVANLYSGPLDDEAAQAIRNCDPNGPLMMYVSKMIPTADNSRFYSFGRVFSGTIKSGSTVRIQGPDYMPGETKDKNDLYVKSVSGVVLLLGPHEVPLLSAQCGNLAALVGVDKFMVKGGTLTTCASAYNFVSMKYSVAPVVRVAVRVANPQDLPKLALGLKRMVKADPLVQVFTSPSGEHIIAGCGELHLEICLKDLRDMFMRDCPLVVSEPVVSYSETMTQAVDAPCMAKSPNKLNRLYMTAQPLGTALSEAIERSEFSTECRGAEDSKRRARKLVEEYKWDATDAKKIWCFGLAPDGHSNALVDRTKGLAYVNEIKEHLVSGFSATTLDGVFTGEPMRGCRFDLVDVKLHPDSNHRGARQLLPPTRRVLYACQLAAGPRLMEPVYACDVAVPRAALSGVFDTLRARRASIISSDSEQEMCRVKASLPVMESFGFTALLRKNTSGQAFPQLVFSHWQLVGGDLYDGSTLGGKVVAAVRARKGMSAELPLFDNFNDKL